MNSFILYLLEASLILVLLYGAYHFLLSKEASFNFNRFFLVAIPGLALLLPLLRFDLGTADGGFVYQQMAELSKARNSYHSTFESWSEWPAAADSQEFLSNDWSPSRVLMTAALLIYIIGLAYQALKLSMAYVKIYRLKKRLTYQYIDGLMVAKLPANQEPFSFLATVFIPANIEDEKEFSQILAHEKVHIRQRHSIDLIFVHTAAVFLWFNPVAWLLIKSLRQTHEYIADKQVLRQGFSMVEYQALLLKQLISKNAYPIVHYFNLSFIKKRMAMMSLKESSRNGRLKAAVAVSIVLIIGLMTSQTNAVPEPTAANQTDTEQIAFYVDNIPLERGLLFSRLRGLDGEFKFAFDNGKKDQVYLGLDLMRKGQLVGQKRIQLREGATIEIRDILSQAQVDDYLVIDLIDGPDEAAKLYTLPLFREGNGWKSKQRGAGPIQQVALNINGTPVSPQKGISLAKLRASELKSLLEYELSEFIDFDVISRQAGGVSISLNRDKKMKRVIVELTVKRKDKLDIGPLLAAAKAGDIIMIQFGKPDGLRFGSMFMLE